MGAARWWGTEMKRLALRPGGVRRLLSALLLLVAPPLAALETVDGVRTLRSADVQQADYPAVQAVHAMGQSLHRQSGGKQRPSILADAVEAEIEKQLQDLILKNKTSKLKGFTGDREEGVLILNDDFSIGFK